MHARQAAMLASVVSLAVGVGVGFMLGRRDSPSTAIAASADEPSREHVNTAAALSEMRRSIEAELERMREQLQARSADESSRQPAVARSDELEKLSSAIERLTALLESSSRRSTDAAMPWKPTIEGLQGAGFATLDAMQQFVRDATRQREETNTANINERLTAAHLLWTPNDIVARYGKPARIDTGDVLSLSYDSIEWGEERCMIEFRTDRLFVVEVMLHCK